MQIAEIAQRLEQTIGLNPSSIGYGAIEQSVKKRMSACRVSTAEAYDQLLAASPPEWTKLIEEVVVPETWFLRDRGAFLALKNITIERWISKRKPQTIRLASMPCSTGEEPYSMAIVLMEAGLAPEAVTIDAVDINTRAIQKAKAALYPETAFRGSDASFRERYFDVSPEGARLHERVRACVTFYQGNLLKQCAPFVSQSYDVIFCRNLMIYLEEKNRRQLLQEIKERLNADGILFVGHAETHLAAQAGFEPLPYQKAFAFQVKSASGGGRQSPPSSRRKRAFVRHDRKKPPLKRKRALESAPCCVVEKPGVLISRDQKAAREVPEKPDAVPQSRQLLKEARMFADRGLLKEAQKKCEAIFRVDPAQVDALFLMAMIFEAQGNRPAAAAYFRKVLYLNPDHEEALLNRGSYLNQNGEPIKARSMRKRLKRLSERRGLVE